MNKLSAQYLAGLLDGEGCIYISKQKDVLRDGAALLYRKERANSDCS